MSSAPFLLLEYRNLVSDLHSHAHRIAWWLNQGEAEGGVDTSEENVSRAVHLSSL
eukprot:CAMPEP_0195644696 /NCGR_PEP_ID=MMETSP0815-20121206/28535_1 /TAXON_ID=97485 /ORGANISM="Prymnesium parvum, Strain Texoma1" /LENGTH=54 /DNA_ID=CAMNT_0040787879 /DNA_START=1 /DNA_END=162 /DNA_ORIENTATION=+